MDEGVCVWMRGALLTDPVSSLSADGCDALDVGSGSGHVVVPSQLRQQVLDQIHKHQRATAHHQVSQGDDGPLPHGQARAGQLGQQAAQDGGVEVHQQAPLPGGGRGETRGGRRGGRGEDGRVTWRKGEVRARVGGRTHLHSMSAMMSRASS